MELDQFIIPWLVFFFILITFLFDVVLILQAEILCWSLMGVKGIMPLDGKEKWSLRLKLEF